jgi:hypothetical protein
MKFRERLAPFSAGRQVLENCGGGRFQEMECWELNTRSLDVILAEADDDLFASFQYGPEDWIFYVDDSILLQIVTHEQEATLRLNGEQYSAFEALGVSHGKGCPKWSGLPETPIRRDTETITG